MKRLIPILSLTILSSLATKHVAPEKNIHALLDKLERCQDNCEKDEYSDDTMVDYSSTLIGVANFFLAEYLTLPNCIDARLSPYANLFLKQDTGVEYRDKMGLVALFASYVFRPENIDVDDKEYLARNRLKTLIFWKKLRQDNFQDFEKGKKLLRSMMVASPGFIRDDIKTLEDTVSDNDRRSLWVLSKIYDSDFGINDEKKSEKYFHKWKKKEQNKIRISVAI